MKSSESIIRFYKSTFYESTKVQSEDICKYIFINQDRLSAHYHQNMVGQRKEGEVLEMCVVSHRRQTPRVHPQSFNLHVLYPAETLADLGDRGPGWKPLYTPSLYNPPTIPPPALPSSNCQPPTPLTPSHFTIQVLPNPGEALWPDQKELERGGSWGVMESNIFVISNITVRL